MNVDASVVVLENIFKHLEEAPASEPRITVILRAVREVAFPVISSTVASIVVFVPLVFTSDLTYALLGDLARAVVFSHGLSAIVALLLVPTVRLQIAGRTRQALDTGRAPLSDWLELLEQKYEILLGRFLNYPRAMRTASAVVAGTLALLLLVVMPRMNRELIAVPDTDWVTLGLDAQGNTTVAQMDSLMERVENRLLKLHGSQLRYTFTRINTADEAWIMARLKDKRQVSGLKAALESEFQNSETEKYWVSGWNPSELPLPDPPLFRVAVRGGQQEARIETARELLEDMNRRSVAGKIRSTPEVTPIEEISLKLPGAQWSALRSKSGIQPGDLAEYIRVLTEGKTIGTLTTARGSYGLRLRYRSEGLASAAALGAMPVGIEGKIVPLRALAQISVQAKTPAVYRENGQETIVIHGRNKTGQEAMDSASISSVDDALQHWSSARGPASSKDGGLSVRREEARKDLVDALSQLRVTVALSVALMFVVLVLQFGSVVDALLVMVSVPLGMIGVILSIWICGSSICLNSVLGALLLNGIAVANSIMLVDSIKREVARGLDPVTATRAAAKSRLRPILITSCTTVLGMLPIALGLGEGGKILQPLGIAVAGGLGFSMLFTLFLVPGLQTRWLMARHRVKLE
jgi:HAE1 family hydrophobic/amphiphilic exporter-1